MPFRHEATELSAIALEQFVNPVTGVFDRNFHLTEGFVYVQREGTPQQFKGHPIPRVIPVETVLGDRATDLASVPEPLWSLIAPHGRQSAPALLHDQECARVRGLDPNLERKRETVRYQLDERLWIDLMFQRALREQHVPRLRARLMWAFVSLQSYFGPAPLRALGIISLVLGATVSAYLGLGAAVRSIAVPEATGLAGWWALLLLGPLVAVLVTWGVRRLTLTLVLTALFLSPVFLFLGLAVCLFKLVEFAAIPFDPQRENPAPPTLER